MLCAIQIIGDELEARQRSKRWLSQRTGVNINTITRWWLRDSPPKWQDIVACARVLNLPLEYLASGDVRDRALRGYAMKRYVRFGLRLDDDQRHEAVGVLGAYFHIDPRPSVEDTA